MKTALIILGHGSRSKDAVDIFNRIVSRIKETGNYELVKGAHMELAEPGLFDVADELAGTGAERIIIVPYFLYEGMHIKKDIPEMIDQLKSKYGNIEFRFAKPIGYEPSLADILIMRAKEADL